jgi:peptidoglycan hydrolase-like protein with peptidoglycan-binding domain
MIRRAQHALRDNGYYEGEIDGAMTPRTTRSLKTYQRENRLPETGELDQQTARSLGILGGSPDTASRAREVSSRRPENSAGAENNEAVLATVLSASANRTSDGAIYVLINTQAPTGGWRWFGDHVVNGDTLEVYARAIRPTGMTTQVLTRGRIELNAKDDVQYVRRVVVHGAGGDINIPLAGRTSPASVGSSPPPSRGSTSPSPGGSSSPTSTPTSTFTIQRQAEDLLSEYTRLVGVRLTGNGIEFEGGSENREADIELLFALDNFVNASQLYARLSGSLQDRGSQRGATLALAREARRADRVMTTTSSRASAQLSRRWDAIRQDVLRLMRAHNITSEELEY